MKTGTTSIRHDEVNRPPSVDVTLPCETIMRLLKQHHLTIEECRCLNRHSKEIVKQLMLLNAQP